MRIVLKEYFNNEPITMEKHRQRLTDMMTDAIFMAGIFKTANYLTEKGTSPVYLYRWKFNPLVPRVQKIKIRNLALADFYCLNL